MTKSEFHDYVVSAFTEYFPKISEENRSDFIATLIDDLQGTDIDLEDDVDSEMEDTVRGRDTDEDY